MKLKCLLYDDFTGFCTHFSVLESCAMWWSLSPLGFIGDRAHNHKSTTI